MPQHQRLEWFLFAEFATLLNLVIFIPRNDS